MISPRVDKLLENVDSPYASVIVAAKRARQINSYYHNLGEGTFEEFPPPMIDTGSKNYLTIALEFVDQHRRTGDALERGPPNELQRALGLQHTHGMACLPGQARQLQRLVGGDPPGDAEEHPRHAQPR